MARVLLAAIAALPALSSDWAFGIFIRDTSMLLHGTHEHTANTGVRGFAASFIKRTAAPRLAMLVDEGTGAALSEFCAWDGSKRCVLMREADVLGAADLPSGSKGSRPRYLDSKRSTLFIRRWWLYIGMMSLAERLDPDAAKSGMGLVTDVRDVLWQDDVFQRLRLLADAMGVRRAGAGPGHGRVVANGQVDTSQDRPHEEPLFFAVEPFNGTVKDERTFNVPCAAQCFPNSVMGRFQHMPLSCAGTTAGSWSALQRYARAMQSYTLFCGGLGKQRAFSGMDQPMHMYLLYDYILSRRASSWAGARTGHGAGRDSPTAAGSVDAAAAGLEDEEAVWQRRYGGLFTPEGLSSYPMHPSRDDEPAYEKLRAVAVRQFGGDVSTGIGAVVPIPLYHVDGAICTLALVPWNTFAPPRDNGFGDITSQGRAGGPVCALVHQYDRHARLVKMVDVLYSGVDPARNYWDPAANMTY